ncbi:MAG: hypothetical protein IIX87_03350 [Firmicutes bacterium]|nr:hypothetical protein [Bacillota bacterium]
MARTIAQIRKDLKNIQRDLAAYSQRNYKDINEARRNIRQKILRGEEVNARDELGTLLKKEYEFEKEQDEVVITADMILKGKDPKSPSFRLEVEQQMIQAELEFFNQFDNEIFRQSIRDKIKNGVEVPVADVFGRLFVREYQNEQELEKLTKEAEKKQEKKPEKAFLPTDLQDLRFSRR